MLRSATFAPLAHRAFALAMAGVLAANVGNSIQAVGAAWQLTAAGEPAVRPSRQVDPQVLPHAFVAGHLRVLAVGDEESQGI